MIVTVRESCNTLNRETVFLLPVNEQALHDSQMVLLLHFVMFEFQTGQKKKRLTENLKM